jgi:hypothetical protein
MGGDHMTRAFYKLDNGQLLYAPNSVLHATYELHADQHQTYTYPVDGWSWFESDQEARQHFGLPEPEPEPATVGATGPVL